MERLYFLFSNGQQTGPFTLAQAREQVVTNATMVWYEGLSGWVAIGHVEELKDLVAAAQQTPAAPPPPTGSAPTATTTTPTDQDYIRHVLTAPVPGYASDAVLADEIRKHHRLLITFILSWIGAAIVVGIMAGGMAAADAEEGAIAVGVLGGVGVLVLIVFNIIHFCKFHYRCWEVAIARTKFTEFPPGQAVGLLFVPFFNLYWIFKSYRELAELLERATMNAPYDRNFAPNKGLALTYCILQLVSLVPWLGSLAALVNIVLWFVMLGENKRACIHLCGVGSTRV